MQMIYHRYIWAGDSIQQVPHTYRFNAVFKGRTGDRRLPGGVIRVSLQCHILHDMIVILDTLWGDMHEVLFLGKYEK
jgi:hypothetical protein